MGMQTRIKWMMPACERARMLVSVLAVIAIMLITISLVPQQAFGDPNATDGTAYTQGLINDSSSSGQKQDFNPLDLDQWLGNTINSKSVEYDDIGSFDGVMTRAMEALNTVFLTIEGAIVILFGAKVAGRAVFSLMFKQDELPARLPMFFLNSKERADKIAPKIMTINAWPSAQQKQGSGPRTDDRTYTAPSQLMDHPYLQFFKDFLGFFFVALGAYALIGVIMGIVSALYGPAGGNAIENSKSFTDIPTKLFGQVTG